MKTETNRTVPATFTSSISVDAMRDLIGYASHPWANVTEWDRKLLKLTLTERDTGKHFVVGPDDLQRAMTLLAIGTWKHAVAWDYHTHVTTYQEEVGYPYVLGLIFSGKAESEHADILVQLAIFGEIKYC